MGIIIQEADNNAYVYLLKHSTENEIKIIGAFSESEIAENALNDLKEEAYFRDYPIDCFSIEKLQVDKNNYAEEPLIFKI